MSIKCWPEADRPREKLITQGASALTDAELLAIFLRTGCQGVNAVDLARQALARFGSLRTLIGATEHQFCTHPGFGRAKFAQLQAVMEMARRHLAEELTQAPSFTQVDTVKRYLQSQLQDQPIEQFSGLLLNTKHQLIRYHVFASGTIDQATVHPREVVKAVLNHNAAAVIFAHNHPSGCPQPSRADHTLTERLCDACALMDIRVLDHIIVGQGQTVSLAQKGWLPNET